MPSARSAGLAADDRSPASWRRALIALDAFCAGLSRLLIFVGATALAALIPLSGWLVFGRYVLNDTPTWVEPASLFLLLVITFPVAAAGIRNEAHLSIDFIRDALPRRVGLVLRLVCAVVLAGFGAIMASSALTLVEFGWANRIPLIGLPDGSRHIPLAVCGACVCLFSVVQVITLLTGAAERGRGAPSLDIAGED